MCFTWQAQGFRALRCRCLKSPTLNPWKGCKFHATETVTLQGPFCVAVAGVRMPRLNFFVAGAILLKHPLKSRCHLNPKSIDNQSDLTLNSFESDISWLLNQLNSTHPLPIGSLSVESSATALCGPYVVSKLL